MRPTLVLVWSRATRACFTVSPSSMYGHVTPTCQFFFVPTSETVASPGPRHVRELSAPSVASRGSCVDELGVPRIAGVALLLNLTVRRWWMWTASVDARRRPYCRPARRASVSYSWAWRRRIEALLTLLGCRLWVSLGRDPAVHAVRLEPTVGSSALRSMSLPLSLQPSRDLSSTRSSTRSARRREGGRYPLAEPLELVFLAVGKRTDRKLSSSMFLLVFGLLYGARSYQNSVTAIYLRTLHVLQALYRAALSASTDCSLVLPPLPTWHDVSVLPRTDWALLSLRVEDAIGWSVWSVARGCQDNAVQPWAA